MFWCWASQLGLFCPCMTGGTLYQALSCSLKRSKKFKYSISWAAFEKLEILCVFRWFFCWYSLWKEKENFASNFHGWPQSDCNEKRCCQFYSVSFAPIFNGRWKLSTVFENQLDSSSFCANNMFSRHDADVGHQVILHIKDHCGCKNISDFQSGGQKEVSSVRLDTKTSLDTKIWDKCHHHILFNPQEGFNLTPLENPSFCC